jgi:putative ABC transport system permease protein
MSGYYLKLAFRNLWSQKKYTFFNSLGLIVACLSILIISTWIKNELSFDRFHSKADRIYRLTASEDWPNGYKAHYAWMFSHDWNKQIEPFFPEIEKIARIAPMRKTAVMFNENKFFTKNVFVADSAFFDVFDIVFTQGSSNNFTKTINSVVISQTIAEKLFHDKSAIGNMIKLSGEFEEKMHDYQIVGIMQPLPYNSHFHADILVNTSDKGFLNTSYYYVLVKNGSNYKSIANKFDSFKKIHIKKENASYFTFNLQPITKIHLFSNKDRELEMNGDIKTVWLFILIGAVILVIAIINYTNLNIASYLKHSDNFIVTQYFGAQRTDTILQFLIESTIVAFFVVLISVLLHNPITDLLGGIDGFNIQGNTGISFTSLICFLLLITLILAGTYPALFFNFSFQRKKNNLKTGRAGFSKKMYLSKLMLIIQFTLSIILIIAAITIKKQNKLALSNRITQDYKNIIIFKNLNWEVKPLYPRFKEELLQSTVITDVSAAMSEPTFDDKDVFTIKDGDLKPEKKKLALHMLICDDNLVNFFNLKIIAGENFPKYIPKQTFESYILNEEATKYLGFDNPSEAIGKRLSFNFDIDSILFGGKIVGVVKDFHYATLHNEIRPLVMFQQPVWYWSFMVKYNPKNKTQALQLINETWKNVYPDYPFDYIYLDDLYNQAYSKEITQSRIINLFSIIGLLIACIGLICLTSYIAETRTKELGIRRVNGAKVADLLIMLNKNLGQWVVIAIVIAFPVGWYVMNRWLQNFAYKTEISWWIFILAGIIVLGIALLTVSWQSWRAATKNPVEALRYE